MSKYYRLRASRRLLNVLVKALVRAGLGPRHTYILQVKGRKTGRAYETPVRLIERDGRRWLVAPYGEREWVKNARAAGVVAVRRGRRIEKLSVRELPPEERAPILHRYATEVPITRPFFDARPADGAGAFAPEAERHPVFELLATNSVVAG